MSITKAKSVRRAKKPAKQSVNGKARSLRDLKAFGLWQDRADTKDPVSFTKTIRLQMEHGNDGR